MSAPSASFQLHLPHSHAVLSQVGEPKAVYQHLLMCMETPRPSHNLDAIRTKLRDFAAFHQLEYAEDAAGNVVIRRAASAGYESATAICVQSHMDMVTSKTTDKEHDWNKDPIIPVLDLANGVLKADRTTLGADDGIGVAATLALLEDKSLQCGMLEGIFTADEETTMGGAENIAKAPFLQSSVMINVDSEEECSVCIGCAGGVEEQLFLPLTRTPVSSGLSGLSLQIHNLLGGHSGGDIHKGRANALQVMARVLDQSIGTTNEKGVVISFAKGGNAPNAIPRDCTFHIYAPSQNIDSLTAALNAAFDKIKHEFGQIEKKPSGENKEVLVPCMKLDVTPLQSTSAFVTSPAQTRQIIDLMLNLPHGPIKVNERNEVETSISFSIISLPEQPPADGADEFLFHLFTRSSYNEDMHDLSRRLHALARMTGARMSNQFNTFPGWAPNPTSPALKQILKKHVDLFGKEPRVYSVHAGLECGLFKIAYPDLDCVSIGPTIEHAHSPDEQLVLSTVEPFYRWLRESIIAIANQSIGK